MDEPQCLTDYRHGPAVESVPLTRDFLGVDECTDEPLVLAGLPIVGLLCADCLEARTA